jgi:aspartyl protease family protein
MALTQVEMEIANPSRPARTEKIELLVDSGAIYTVAPARLLRSLGIRPLAKEEFILKDGSKVTRRKGAAIFKLGKRIGGADVIFGEESDSQLLGALTLGALGLSLDPLRRELKPLPMILGGWRSPDRSPKRARRP